jgi:DNA repair exonuclease SbcCD nuclease subunit
MKFAFIADIHLSRYGQDPIEPTSGLPERLHGILNSLSFIVDYCRKNKIKDIVIGGDILHGKSIIYALAQDVMLQLFNDCHDMHFRVIDGNHDLSGKGEDAVSALRSLEKVPNVEWISKEIYEEENMIFVPYSTKVVEQVKQSESDILISHFGLSEGVLNSGISIISNISMSDLRPRYKLVLLGHYHKPQEIIEDDTRMYYVGSSVQLDWGEKGDIKRFLIVDSKTLKVQSVPTKGYRKFMEFELTSKHKKEVLELAKEAKQQGHYVKLLKREKIDITGFEEFNVVDKTEVDVTDRGITSSMSQREKLERYLEIKEIPENERQEYLEQGLQIIDACEVSV